mmetsp:Transcript_1263/g.2469  ORF Transcript_1263/g.2469 Transcript_1263/m.2469 type:complete len:157 (+) Transcript_1263:97-567(+)
MCDSISIATERAIVSLGYAIADGLSQGYDTVAKSTEEALFPVQTEQNNAPQEIMRRKTPTEWDEQEVTIANAYADVMANNKAALEEEEEKKKKHAKKLVALPSLPSFRRKKSQPEPQPQAQPLKKKTEPEKKAEPEKTEPEKKKYKPQLRLFHRGY